MELKVAVVQIDYNPAFVEGGQSFIEEPFFMDARSRKEVNLISLPPPVDFSPGLKTLRQDIGDAYLRLYKSKLEAILEHCAKQAVQVVVFPEYSVPVQLLSVFHERRQDFDALIAGSHIIVNRRDPAYADIGLTLKQEDEGTALCPIFLRKATRHSYKIKGSSLDPDLRPGHRTEPMILDSVSSEISLQLLVCSDFLEENHERAGEHHVVQMIGVPSMTPRGDEFKSLALKRTRDQGLVVLFANHARLVENGAAARGGGSRIWMENRETLQPFADVGGTPPIPAGSEGITIATIQVRRRFPDRSSKHTEYGHRAFLRSVEVVPLVSELPGPGHEYVRELMEPHKDPLTLAQWVRQEESLEILRRVRLHPVLERNLRCLAFHGHLTEDQIRRLCSCVAARGATSELEGWRAVSAHRISLWISRNKKSWPRDTVPDLENRAEHYGRLAEEDAFKRTILDVLGSPDELSEEDFYSSLVAAHLLERPSSLEVEVALLEWTSRQILPRKETIEQVLKKIRLVRPFPAWRLLDQLLSRPHEEWADMISTELDARKKRDQDLAHQAGKCEFLQRAGRIAVYGFAPAVLRCLDSVLDKKKQLVVLECPNRLSVDTAPDTIRALEGQGYKDVGYLSMRSLSRLAGEIGDGLLVMTGANAISPTAMINTLGTALVAAVSRAHSWKLCLAGLSLDLVPNEKWDEARITLENQRRSEPRVWDSTGAHVGVRSFKDYAYDEVPLELFDCVLMDLGVWTTGIDRKGMTMRLEEAARALWHLKRAGASLGE